MFKVEVRKNSYEAYNYCLENFGTIGMVVPCHDPWIYKIVRLITWIWREPDRLHDFYVKEGRWGNSRFNADAWTTKPVNRNSVDREIVSSIFYFNSSRDATMFKLAWGGNL